MIAEIEKNTVISTDNINRIISHFFEIVKINWISHAEAETIANKVSAKAMAKKMVEKTEAGAEADRLILE